ncbi:MAG TPA: cytochrome c biogenesis protein CcsA, partial [Acidimicrobiia bacterium]
MRAQLGFGLLTIATVACALGFATLATGLATGRRALLELGRRYVAVVLVSVIAAFVVMETALYGHDFSIKYVADNVARATPGLYTFTAAWAALEGSILLWALLLSVYVAVTTWRFRNRADDPLVAWATLVQYGVLLFFFALMLFAANPFKQVTGAVPFDGAGPNPLLQNHPLVAIHPPFLYTGYVGFAIPFSFALAALITGRFGEGWLAAVRRTTLVSWGFLTVGIVLGAWWSYSVLGWGGFWGWDPVENA